MMFGETQEKPTCSSMFSGRLNQELQGRNSYVWCIWVVTTVVPTLFFVIFRWESCPGEMMRKTILSKTITSIRVCHLPMAMNLLLLPGLLLDLDLELKVKARSLIWRTPNKMFHHLILFSKTINNLRTPSTKVSTLNKEIYKILWNFRNFGTSVASTLIICIFKMLGHCSRILVTVSLWDVDDLGRDHWVGQNPGRWIDDSGSMENW